MILLAGNSLTSPAIGTIFWAVLIFSIFFLVLAKFAWKPILSALRQRDDMIKGSLEAAEKARKDMVRLQSDNEAVLRKAREEREDILREARDVRDKLIAEAKGRATQEAAKIVENAKAGIEREKTQSFIGNTRPACNSVSRNSIKTAWRKTEPHRRTGKADQQVS